MKSPSKRTPNRSSIDSRFGFLIDRYEAARERNIKAPPGERTQEIVRELRVATDALCSALNQRAVETGEFGYFHGHYIYAVDGAGELYRWRRDFGERQNRPGKRTPNSKRKCHG